MPVHQHREKNGEELPRGGYRGANEGVEVANGKVDEVLSKSRREGETQERALHRGERGTGFAGRGGQESWGGWGGGAMKENRGMACATSSNCFIT